jgi:hypothetical protein
MKSESEARLAPHEIGLLTEEVRAAARRLSRDQILDLADVLHAVIRERQCEARSWQRLQSRGIIVS